MEYDFGGIATKYNLLCSDGRVIRKGAFDGNNGETVPLVWQHNHEDLSRVLGHAVLETRDDDVYAYCTLNNTENGKLARELIASKDLQALSIYANKLVQKDNEVIHGNIREVSLVLAGANPGAFIDNLAFVHSDGETTISDEEAIIYTGFPLELKHEDTQAEHISHADAEDDSKNDKKEDDVAEKEEEKTGKTVGQVFDTLTDEQKDVVYFLVGKAVEDATGGEEDEENEEDEEASHSDLEGDAMKKNVFDNEEGEVLSHSEIEAVFADAPRIGSLKEAFLQHGITQLDVLFPEAKAVTPTPELIARDQTWVQTFWNSLRKSPFARIKSTAANLTADDARAKGYIKGKQKVEEQFALLKRKTEPTTVYKLQKLDRDDVIDITELDVVSFLKGEMRMMLEEELARAVLVGDGRSNLSNDKINEENIRPVYTDEDMYTIKYTVEYPENATNNDKSEALIDAALLSRKEYKGSGNPNFYASTDVINQMLLARDKIGHRMYASLNELAAALRVNAVIEVPVLEGITREDKQHNYHELLGLIFNPKDYTIGADRAGAVTMFDDFDIDYNKYEYLIETRCSGALYKPYAAIALEIDTTAPTTSGSGDGD